MGLTVFLASPFAIQLTCVAIVYVEGTEKSVSVTWSVFVFVIACCVLPPWWTVRAQQRKTKREAADLIRKYELDESEEDEEGNKKHQIEDDASEEDLIELATNEALASVVMIWGFVWVYTALLTLVPASLIVNDDHGTMAKAGAVLYVSLLWILGWGYLWLYGADLPTIQPEQRLLNIPADNTVRLKLVAIVIECYNYCKSTSNPPLPVM